nr:hypothetical protein [Polyangiaceae bacterium]
QFTDIMGYCQNEWISDYNYQKWFTRQAYVNSTAFIKNTDPERAPGMFRTLIIEEDGSTLWGYQMQMHDPVMGEKRTVNVLDENGNVTGTVTGFFNQLSHRSGGFLRVRVSDLTVLPPENTLKLSGAAALGISKLAHAPN